ncbi:MAG: 3-ketoacyl-ACP reductase [Proteobacteria bacterium]|nr:3-ketoacyl-ACP reductase [Pseudomonadota bacterium]
MTKRRNMPVALVTGGTAGIGKSIALSLAKEGYAVVINGRRPESEVAELMESLGRASGSEGSCSYVKGDIAAVATREELLSVVRDRYGSLQVLVNNAGVSTRNRKDMLELKEEEIIDLLRINLVAPFLLASTMAPLLKSDGSPSYLINIASISSYTVSTNRADYCISKAGLSMTTQLFAQRLADENVRVFEIRPGIIKTDMTAPVEKKYDDLIADGLLPIDRWGVPEDVSKTVLGIVKGYRPYATGETINVDGGFHIRRL